jgi:hypothetical protein
MKLIPTTLLLSLLLALFAACGDREELEESSSFEDRFREMAERAEDTTEEAADETEEAAEETADTASRFGNSLEEAAREASRDLGLDDFKRSVGDLGNELEQRLENLESYGYEQRDRFADQYSQGMSELESTLEDLESKAGELGASTRRSVENLLGELEGEYERLEGRAAELRDAGAAEWDELSSEVVEGWQEVEKLIQRVQAELQ